MTPPPQRMTRTDTLMPFAPLVRSKRAVVGLRQTLCSEGWKYSVRVNCLAPTAATQMTDGVLAADALAHLAPEAVSPGLLTLVGNDAPTRAILCAGAGPFAAAHVTLTDGLYVGKGEGAAPRVVDDWERGVGRGGQIRRTEVRRCGKEWGVTVETKWSVL